MRRYVLAVGLSLGAVAYPGSTAAQAKFRVEIPGWENYVATDSVGAHIPLAAPRADLLKAIDSVFTEYGLPLEAFDPRMGRIPNRRVTRTRRLGKTPISRYLDCGRGLRGPAADTDRVLLAAIAWPEPATGEVALLRVIIAAAAQDPAGTRNDYALCVSKGAFELEFAGRVRAILGR